ATAATGGRDREIARREDDRVAVARGAAREIDRASRVDDHIPARRLYAGECADRAAAADRNVARIEADAPALNHDRRGARRDADIARGRYVEGAAGGNVVADL